MTIYHSFQQNLELLSLANCIRSYCYYFFGEVESVPEIEDKHFFNISWPESLMVTPASTFPGPFGITRTYYLDHHLYSCMLLIERSQILNIVQQAFCQVTLLP